MHLAVVDLPNILFNVPLFIAYHVYNEATFNTSSAAWWTTFSFLFFTLLNLNSLLILIVDRHFALAHAFKYKLWQTRQKALVAICLTWVFSLLIVVYGTSSLYRVESGNRTVLYYRMIYVRNYNRQYHIALIILFIVFLVVGFSILTLRLLLRQKICSEKNVHFSRQNVPS